jgi:hypothetical protein
MKSFILSFSLLFGILFFGGLDAQSAFAQNDDNEQVYLAQADHGNADQAATHGENTVVEAEGPYFMSIFGTKTTRKSP